MTDSHQTMRLADYSVVITTPRFVKGQETARNIAKLDCEPNWKLLDRADSEFRAGFRYEWNEYIAPLRKAEAGKRCERCAAPLIDCWCL